jgi:toxin HigB-1
VKPVVTRVLVSRKADRQLRRIPAHIRRALEHWIGFVNEIGVREVRMVRGYHDEPLQGLRFGQRSVRLNRSYRAIYVETVEGIELLVMEVSKHGY